MRDDRRVRRSAVLDIETGPNVDAMLCAEPRPATESDVAALHRVRTAVVLTFGEVAGNGPTGLRFERFGTQMREQELIARIDRVLPEPHEGNRLITFNGRSWDVPMLMQRAAAAWCFMVPRLSAWSEADAARHVDMMRRGGARPGRGWSSLADRAAAIGIDMRLARGKATRTPASIRRRCTADVAATFLLYAAGESVRRSDARFFAEGWLALAEAVRADPAVFGDLRYLAEHPVLDGCRALLGGNAAFTSLTPGEVA
jgi:hypothetical protein